MSIRLDNSLKHLLLAFALVLFAGLSLCACGGNDGTSPSNGAASGEGKSANNEAQSSSFDATIEGLRGQIETRIKHGVPVPVPADGGGGYTHEQHKQNAKTIYEAGKLYELTGEDKYKDFALTVLEDYAKLYPTLGLHPKRKEGHPAGMMFWQGLNESWWLVYVNQGYESIRADLSDEQRSNIEDNLFHPMVEFLSEGSPDTFNRIHNHGTWAAAAVGMTGFVLDNQEYVDKALYGLDKSGDAGFLKQIDLLFSPDGYYTEGPYYQRYALMPYILFAQAIERNQPEQKIFEYKDGVILKAMLATVQLSYNDKFFPINDAIREKGLNTAELRYAMAIAYDLTKDPSLLSIAERQDPFVPTIEGRALAEAIDAGKSVPFKFKSMKFRDGGQGEGGALLVLRSGEGRKDAAVVMKATSQGLGHGHFDRLGLLYFDNGGEVIADYGASRFLNVEPKNGGHYLTENRTWAKQTVAHNTLVVDEKSHFGGDWRVGEEHTPEILAFEDSPGASFMAARSNGAYEDTTLTRIIAMVDRDSGGQYVVDVMVADSETDHTFDLPIHFKGQLIETTLPFQHKTELLTPMGRAAGYQHLWKASETPALAAGALQDFSILLEDKFYTLTFAVDLPVNAYLTRVGANDPDNNLRNEQALLLRSRGQAASFVSVYERHGLYDSDEEVTVYAGGTVKEIRTENIGDVTAYITRTDTNKEIVVFYAEGADEATEYELTYNNESVSWRGPVGLHVLATSGSNDQQDGGE